MFDNALIVHLRGAMLEPMLLFFSALTILAFLLLKDEQNDKRFGWWSILFGASLGCVLTTKVVGLVLILLIPAVTWMLWPRKDFLLRFAGIGAAAFLITYIGVWQTHFALGSTINPALPDQGYYQASPQYKAVLGAGKPARCGGFP